LLPPSLSSSWPARRCCTPRVPCPGMPGENLKGMEPGNTGCVSRASLSTSYSKQVDTYIYNYIHIIVMLYDIIQYSTGVVQSRCLAFCQENIRQDQSNATDLPWDLSRLPTLTIDITFVVPWKGAASGDGSESMKRASMDGVIHEGQCQYVYTDIYSNIYSNIISCYMIHSMCTYHTSLLLNHPTLGSAKLIDIFQFVIRSTGACTFFLLSEDCDCRGSKFHHGSDREILNMQIYPRRFAARVLTFNLYYQQTLCPPGSSVGKIADHCSLNSFAQMTQICRGGVQGFVVSSWWFHRSLFWDVSCLSFGS
jgi:hypothetical protein